MEWFKEHYVKIGIVCGIILLVACGAFFLFGDVPRPISPLPTPISPLPTPIFPSPTPTFETARVEPRLATVITDTICVAWSSDGDEAYTEFQSVHPPVSYTLSYDFKLLGFDENPTLTKTIDTPIVGAWEITEDDYACHSFSLWSKAAFTGTRDLFARIRWHGPPTNTVGSPVILYGVYMVDRMGRKHYADGEGWCYWDRISGSFYNVFLPLVGHYSE